MLLTRHITLMWVEYNWMEKGTHANQSQSHIPMLIFEALQKKLINKSTSNQEAC